MRLHRITYVEHERPTVIRDGRTGRDIPASGSLWVDDSGVVWRSEVRLDKADTFVRIRAVYERTRSSERWCRGEWTKTTAIATEATSAWYLSAAIPGIRTTAASRRQDGSFNDAGISRFDDVTICRFKTSSG